jgi:hypothetical protein
LQFTPTLGLFAPFIDDMRNFLQPTLAQLPIPVNQVISGAWLAIISWLLVAAKRAPANRIAMKD